MNGDGFGWSVMVPHCMDCRLVHTFMVKPLMNTSCLYFVVRLTTHWILATCARTCNITCLS